jgi:acyl phosphate:glycerol-3-phosphate acyltransferase
MVALFLLTAYVIGSIPWSVWIGKAFYGVDVREHGSRNAGATNTFRVLGRKAGTAVLLLDIAKGIGAAMLALTVKDAIHDPEQYKLVQLGLALAATLGHVYPVLAKFKGGKGVATLTGALFYIFPEAALVAFGVFIAVFLVTNYISLSSMTASVAIACAALIMYRYDYWPLVLLIVLIPLLVIFTHRSNVQRLLHGNENKMHLIRHKR